MGGLEPVRDLGGQVEQPLHPDRAALDEVLERLALQQLHDDEGLALVLPDLVDRADVRVVEGGGGPGLAQEPVERGAVAGGLGGEELQGDGSVEDAVVCPVDDAHTAATELLDDPVVRDVLSDHLASPGGRHRMVRRAPKSTRGAGVSAVYSGAAMFTWIQ